MFDLVMMTLIEWFKRRATKTGGEQARWRQSWTEAIDSGDTSRLPVLRDELKSLSAVAGDVEVEEEMLEALQHLSDLQASIGDGPLPAIETHHRIVGSDACHFSAPASLPDDPAQPSGRVLLTSTRSLFLGGAQGSAIPWHSIRDVLRIERDVLLVRADGSPAAHFRFNSFSDAVTATFMARRLKKRQKAELP